MPCAIEDSDWAAFGWVGHNDLCGAWMFEALTKLLTSFN